MANNSYIAGKTYLQFGRAYSIAIGPPATQGVKLQSNALLFDTTNPDPAKRIRIRFDIDRVSVGASKAKIEIFNLNGENRKGIVKGFLVQLQAGYNSLINEIFIGSVLIPTSTRNGPDIITALECQDGGLSLTLATRDFTYPPLTTFQFVLEDLGKAMNLNSVNLQPQPFPIVAVFPKGLTVSGAIKGTLDMLCKNYGLEWNVRNGNLNVYPIKTSGTALATIISADTGMIGVPSNNGNFTQFTNLLNPQLFPGALVNLKSQNLEKGGGIFVIRRAHFEGDSHDNKWQVSCECIPQWQPNPISTSNVSNLDVSGIA